MSRAPIAVEVFHGGEWVVAAQVLTWSTLLNQEQAPEVVWGAVYSEENGVRFEAWLDSLGLERRARRMLEAELEDAAIEKAIPWRDPADYDGSEREHDS